MNPQAPRAQARSRVKQTELAGRKWGLEGSILGLSMGREGEASVGAGTHTSLQPVGLGHPKTLLLRLN